MAEVAGTGPEPRMKICDLERVNFEVGIRATVRELREFVGDERSDASHMTIKRLRHEAKQVLARLDAVTEDAS